MTDPDQHARALAAEAAADNDATGWFERLYAEAEAGDATVPWDTKVPHPLLVEWADAVQLQGGGEPALVIGCGYGDDAEFAAARGFDVTAFDVSPSAIAGVRDRFPGSSVHYVAADLFELPPAWRQAYQLVIEIFTVQALPVRLREAAVAAISETVAPGGRLIVIQRRRPDGPVPDGPPWPLTRADIDLFTANGLVADQIELLPDADGNGARWRAEFRRPG
ncbi:MAG: class I SAM-dependent methyltransferase [Hamadaea sp.]|uniref:class I SAM-dependent methyltransferase n=1 Tax=Hamadaea sp. TaxID=2024425 RepID=UPI0017F8D073|nr:class I SAM-dependent methyltransferase [Hamadaea sp.]NUR72996.1 class I SAM-dependent methyltransferase [Hamadaea sp.]NUT21218.1 class I SAM-dependent methyltransferase [Hamadaea sp.]